MRSVTLSMPVKNNFYYNFSTLIVVSSFLFKTDFYIAYLINSEHFSLQKCRKNSNAFRGVKNFM